MGTIGRLIQTFARLRLRHGRVFLAGTAAEILIE
jgi:hypothetical protein